MTNQSPESVIAEVIEYHADDIDTHGPGCYKNHAACLAVKLRDMLREPGELAALAAVERVRVIHARDEHGLCVECSWEYPETSYDALSNDVSWPCPTVAALDVAPEPDTITIPRPVVPFGPVSKTENEATADYLLEVVKKINGKYCTVGGSNVTAAVRKLLTDAADAVRGLPVEGEVKGNV